MKIVNIGNEKINAVFVFTVGNCEISVSTIMNKERADIAIFDKYSNGLLKDKLASVQAAISWCSNYGPRD